MTRSVLAALAILASSAAYAQTAPGGGAPEWTGFYLGANAGVLGGESGTIAGTPGFSRGTFWGAMMIVNPFTTVGNGRTRGMTSLMGGGQLGYNYQIGQVVWGAEADIQAVSPVRDSRTVDETKFGRFLTAATTIETRQRYDYLGTVRGRIGYLVLPNLLVFATGGIAYANRQSITWLDRAATTATPSRSVVKTGYVVGGGVEYALGQNWSVKGEGLFYDLGKTHARATVTSPDPFFGRLTVGQVLETSRDRGIIGRIGLNYRFGGS
ncbi:outer membrane protein [Enterovirga rhinocerotis]|uniref:Outer membrane immunogenic protein n=1 Tax=Enterovirga rhinocerotis TaxID=1339210 RepID=A0A4R7BW55_9HYPH|nr:outer membrane beta-barrel protein [Enterovirga rhinocerotis]TDR90084.1 outer membrane immunogenic protein [Enterovirga rhinocerotis]